MVADMSTNSAKHPTGNIITMMQRDAIWTSLVYIFSIVAIIIYITIWWYALNHNTKLIAKPYRPFVNRMVIISRHSPFYPTCSSPKYPWPFHHYLYVNNHCPRHQRAGIQGSTYIVSGVPPFLALSEDLWTRSKVSWPADLDSSGCPPRERRSVVSVTVSFAFSWVDFVESGMISSLASVGWFFLVLSLGEGEVNEERRTGNEIFAAWVRHVGWFGWLLLVCRRSRLLLRVVVLMVYFFGFAWMFCR